METVAAVSAQELTKFGCPYCGGVILSQFASIGQDKVFCCETCWKECVASDNLEGFEKCVKDTDIRDLIDKHPQKQTGSVMVEIFGMTRNTGHNLCFMDGDKAVQSLVLKCQSYTDMCRVIGMFHGQAGMKGTDMVVVSACQACSGALTFLSKNILEKKSISCSMIKKAKEYTRN